MSNFIGIHHSTVIVSDTARSLDFYCNLLGMETTARADLPFPGAWLKVGEQQIHLMELVNPDPVDKRPEHGGRDRHTALMVRDLNVIQQALEKSNVAFTVSRSGRSALFCRDPDGNTLEMIEV